MILKNCRLIPELCEGFAEERADIRIEGDSIAEILSAGGNYTGEEIIDCEGKTVLPGLFNLHMHFFFKGDEFTRTCLRSEPEILLQGVRYMYELMSYGFTSLRDVGTQYNAAIKIRDHIQAGTLAGPDLKACGLILTPDMVCPPLGCYSSDYGHPVNDPHMVRAAVRKQLAEGADYIKILGCSAAPTRRGDGSLFYDDEMLEFKNSVAAEGTYMAVHTNSPESFDSAVNFEARSIEHGNFMTRENLDNLIAHGYKSAIVPTLHITWAWGGEEMCAAHCASLRMAHDAGVLLGFGTDAEQLSFTANPAAEFIARQKVLGLSGVEILKQATINSAKINGTDDLRGSIKVGKKADFAIIDGKPDEDVTLFGKPCAYVIKDGTIYAQEGRVKVY